MYLLGLEYFAWCWFVKTYSSVSYSDETSIVGKSVSLFLSTNTTNIVTTEKTSLRSKFKHGIIGKEAKLDN